MALTKEIEDCVDTHVKDLAIKNSKQWSRFFTIAAVIFCAMLAIGAVQLRVSTKNSVIISQWITDERLAVDYRTWYRYNMVTSFELRALSSFLNGDEAEFLDVMNEFESFKAEITKDYRIRSADVYRGIFEKKDNLDK